MDSADLGVLTPSLSPVSNSPDCDKGGNDLECRDNQSSSS